MRIAAISKKQKSPYFSSRLSHRHKIWQGGANWSATPYQPTKFQIHKSKMGDSRHLENCHKSLYLNNGLTNCHEIYQDDTFLPLASYVSSVMKDNGRPPLLQSENRHILAMGWPTAIAIWRCDAYWPFAPYWPIKFRIFKIHRWRPAVILKIEKSPNHSKGSTDCIEILQGDPIYCPTEP